MRFPLFADNPLKSRVDLQRLAQDLTAPLVPHFSQGRARVQIGENRAGYGDPPGLLEGFARPLWGLVPLAAGGGDFAHWDLWREGIANGTNPDHPEYWGIAGDFDQRSVEQAAFGFGLTLAPEKLWTALSPAAKSQLSTWLQRINQVQLVQSNWLFFRVLVNLGLRRCGQPWSEERVNSDLAQIDTFYLGKGWYSDGKVTAHYRDGRTGDYYIPMAFHFYGLIYARIVSAEDPTRAARFVERARLFAQDFVHWFSAEGSAIPFGRSLTYRFAQGAFWGALAFSGTEALPWGVIKGIFLRHMRWWMQQPVFSETGLLTIGYTYPNLYMAESYNSSGSPYWAMKAFLPLALPAEHPFWRAEEAPLPPRRTVHTVAGANLILVTDSRSRDVTALNPGQLVLDWPRNAPHKYSKCAYATRFGFSVPTSVPTPAEGGMDNGLSVGDTERFLRVREQCFDAAVANGVAYSRWPAFPDVNVHTWVIADEFGHVRIHKIDTARPLWTFEGGFAVGYNEKSTLRMRTDAPAGPEVRTPRGASVLSNLLGERRAECVDVGANSSLYTSLSAMPGLRAELSPGQHWLACWANGSADSNEDFPTAQPFTIEVESSRCRVLQTGQLWWSNEGGPCGTSGAAREALLRQVV